MKTFQDGDPVFGVMMNAIANLWPNGTAVLSGCAPTGSGAARQVTVAAGSVVINGTVRSVSQQTKTLDAATFDRYDLISVNTSGSVVVTKGTEERRVPALPANSVPIAICLIVTGQTALPADRIYDTRLLASYLVAGQLILAEGLVSSGKTILNSSGVFAGGGAAYVLYADSACAAANLCNQVLTEYSRQNDSYGKMMELSPIPSSVAIPNVKHTVTVQWQTKVHYGAPYVGYTRVYINGSPVGVEKTTSSTGYTTVSDTIEVMPEDIISIWGHGTTPAEYSTGIVYVSNVKLFAFAVPAGRPQMW